MPTLPGGTYTRDEAEAHLAWLGRGDHMEARCSLWWTRAPTLRGRRVGAIGHYAAADAQAGTALLKGACARLRQAGCELAVGPMDGNTWRRYRLVTEGEDEPAFFLEPDDPAEWVGHFEAVDFERIAQYRSSVCDDLTWLDRRVERVGRRLDANGVRVRALRRHRLDEELRRIHDVALDAFGGATLYQPLEFDAFRRQMEPMLGRVDSSLVLLAEQAGVVVGFAFGVPDFQQAERGDPIDTMVLKTLAVRPRRSLAGLGGLLMQLSHEAARQAGLRRVIHALMHEANGPILALSSRYARPIRRYGLFAKDLT